VLGHANARRFATEIGGANVRFVRVVTTLRSMGLIQGASSRTR
jgi:hypothetical protein